MSNLNYSFTEDSVQSAIHFPKSAKNYSSSKESKSKEFYNLPVYKKCVELNRQLAASTQKTPNNVKFGIVKDIHAKLVDIMAIISFASLTNRDKKVGFLKQALKEVKKTQIYIRILFDIRAITKNGFAAVSSLSEDLMRQLTGWLKSEISKL